MYSRGPVSFFIWFKYKSFYPKFSLFIKVLPSIRDHVLLRVIQHSHILAQKVFDDMLKKISQVIYLKLDFIDLNNDNVCSEMNLVKKQHSVYLIIFH